jgi:hypothetical protein
LDYQLFDELTKRMKVDVPDFDGKLEPNAFEDWLIVVEDYFDWFVVLKDCKVCYARINLKEHARAWWGSMEEQLCFTQHLQFLTWKR